MSSKIQEYLRYKDLYLKSFNPDQPLKKIDIFNIETNMKVIFYEMNGKYIMEVIDPIDNSIIHYRKTISSKQVIDLSYLYKKYQDRLNDMNVDFNKVNYINRLDDMISNKSKLLSLKNTTELNSNLELQIDELENQYQLLQSEFDMWYNSIQNLLVRINIIEDINYNNLKNDNEKINEYTQSYYWLNSKLSKSSEDFHYIMSLLHSQNNNISINDIVTYARNYYIVRNINNRSDITIQSINKPYDTKNINIKDIIHKPGDYLIFKDYTITNNTITPITDIILSIPPSHSSIILSKLTYQSTKWNIGDLVLYNDSWYIINSISTDNVENISIQDINDMNNIISINKGQVTHIVGYRNKYKNIRFTDELILPIDKWINSYNDVSSKYVDNRNLFQSSTIQKGDIVKYNNLWYIVISISRPNIIIRSLENKNDTSTKSVLISEVSHHDGYYNKYKNFRYTDNIIIPLNEWINKLNVYGITEDVEDYIEELDEYPATNGVSKNKFIIKEESKTIKTRKTVKKDDELDDEEMKEEKEESKSRKTRKTIKKDDEEMDEEMKEEKEESKSRKTRKIIKKDDEEMKEEREESKSRKTRKTVKKDDELYDDIEEEEMKGDDVEEDEIFNKFRIKYEKYLKRIQKAKTDEKRDEIIKKIDKLISKNRKSDNMNIINFIEKQLDMKI
jgi:hypothetical protein